MTKDIDLAELEQMSRRQKEDLAKNIFVRPSIWSRLKKLPIYLHREGTAKEKKVHISDENLAEKVPKEREKFLKLIKDTPEIIDEIEKHPRLEQIVFTSEPVTRTQKERKIPFSKRKFFRGGFTWFQPKESPYEPEPLPKTIKQQIQKNIGTVVISLKPQPYERFKYAEEGIEKIAFHELKHVGQLEEYPERKFKRMFKGKYAEQKGEAEAREFAEKKAIESFGKHYERFRKKSRGDIRSPDVQEAIKRADLLLKRTY